ncbi:MAG: hypothetical protein HXY40_17795 [Chloroflexi bacterium]|nr:hypothetical protein [Chloroflexota bacterium]
MAAINYTLEHFYYGRFVRGGKAEGEMRLLAKTPAVSDDLIDEATRLALLPPLSNVHGGAWAIVRGKLTPFILVQTALNPAGQPVLHFVLLPGEVVRSLGGHLRALMTLLDDTMPQYERSGFLQALTLRQPPPQSPAEQSDSILNLMTFTKNKFATLEKLVAAIVQNVPIVVHNAPRDLRQRTAFIEGLLALLPASARFGVTFATHATPNSKLDAQIRFFGEGALPDNAMTFDWNSGALGGKSADDDYAHFIISQLRLDTDLVIQQTSALTGIASWRIKRGDKLSDALQYAAYRLSIDDALRNQQPVEIDDVSKVLAEDPTLDEDQRRMYALHLLAFALALGDMSQALPVAVSLRHSMELEREVLAQMANALREGKAELVFYALLEWLENPLGPQGARWVELLHVTTLKYLEALVKSGDVEGTNALIQQAVNANPGVQMARIIPKMIELALPLTVRDSNLALNVLTMAVTQMDNETLRHLLTVRQFMEALPRPVTLFARALEGARVTQEFSALNLGKPDVQPTSTQEMLSVLDQTKSRRTRDLLDDTQIIKRGTGKLSPEVPENRQQAGEFPAVGGEEKRRGGLLIEAARIFPQGTRRIALMRFIELALAANRADLVETTALAGVVKVAISPTRDQYQQTLLWVLRALQPDNVLNFLEPPGQRYLLQIMLACGLHRELGQEILRHARIFYPGDKQSAYLEMVQRVFAETPIPVEAVAGMLSMVQDAGLKGVPLMMAYIGVLESHDWSPDLARVAAQATQMLEVNRIVLQEVMPVYPVLSLLKYHALRQDVTNAIRVADFVPVAAARQGGLSAVTRMYKMMQWESRTKTAAHNVLRRFVRYAEDDEARKAIQFFGKDLGPKIQESLEATYFFRAFTGDLDLQHYADQLKRVHSLLYTMAQAYDDQRIMPSLGSILNDLDSLTGGLSDEQRLQIAQNCVDLGEVIVVLGQYHKEQKGARDANQVQNLLIGKAEAKSVLDVWRVLGGHLTKGKRIAVEFMKSPHQHPLGERSAPVLLEDTSTALYLLRAAARTLNPKRPLNVSALAIQNELESLWAELSLREQRDILPEFSTALHQLGDLIMLIAEKGGREALQDNTGLAKALDSGKQRPKTALELLRYVHGYFERRVR